MGIHDRPYARRPSSRGLFAAFSPLSITTALIALNLLVWILNRLIRPAARPDLPTPLFQYGHYSLATLQHFQLWRLLTFPFLHPHPFPLFTNMLCLFLFGPIVESQLGPKRYLALYLLASLAAAATYTILALTHTLIPDPTTPLTGSSAGTLAILLTAALTAGDVPIPLYMELSASLRTLAWVAFAVATYATLTTPPHSQPAHLAGPAVALLLLYRDQIRDFVHPHPHRRRLQKDWSRDFNR